MLLLPAETTPRDKRDDDEHQPDYQSDVNEAAKGVRADEAQEPQDQEDNSNDQ